MTFLQACNSSTIQKDCANFYSSEIHKICLPKLDSLVECSNHETIKQALISLKGEDNNIIGYYIPESAYQKLDTLLSLNYDNFVQISLHKQFNKSKISFSTYMEVVKLMNDNFYTEYWDKIKEIF